MSKIPPSTVAIPPARTPNDAELPPRESSALRVFAWLDRKLDAFSDYINPILVKETRQALKSQQFVIWYLLLLAGCWVVTMGGLAMIGPAAYYGASGGQLFLWYAWMLALPLLVVAPFSAFRSLTAEQEDNTRDLLTVSALSPYQVINGKLGGAALQIVIYLAALAPCLGFAYLLRGVDALTLLLLPAAGVLASLGLSLVGLLLASLSRLRYLQILLNVAFITTLLVLFYNSYELLEEFVERGYQLYQNPDWYFLGAELTLYATTFLLLYFLAVACNTFTSANRSTPLRVAMLIQQAAFIGWVAALWLVTQEATVPVVGYYIALVYWTVAGMFLTSEGPILSPRVRRTLPESLFARQLFTWFSPGPGTGYFFVASNLTLLLALSWVAINLSENWRGVGGDAYLHMTAQGMMTAYAVAYLGLGRLVILLLRRLAELSLVGGFLVHLLLMLGGGSLPYAFEASSSMFRRDGFSYLDLPSPVAVALQTERGGLTEVEQLTAVLVVGGIALCVLVVNVVLAAKEVRQTRLPLPQRIIDEDFLRKSRLESRPTNPWGDAPPTLTEPTIG